LAKGLGKDRFSWPASADATARRGDPEPAALSMLLAGLNLKDGAKKHGMSAGCVSICFLLLASCRSLKSGHLPKSRHTV
jgi:hypothetical protein